MFSFFDAVISFVSVVVQIVINGFNFLITFFTGIISYFDFCFIYLSQLPMFIMGPATMCLVVIIALQFFNKGS